MSDNKELNNEQLEKISSGIKIIPTEPIKKIDGRGILDSRSVHANPWIQSTNSTEQNPEKTDLEK